MFILGVIIIHVLSLMVVKGIDIRRLLKRRMEMWRLEHYDELLFEFERCAKKWVRSSTKQPCPNHMVQVFSCLMLRGQVRSAVRWLTERMNDGGVLDPSQLVNDGSKRVLDVLREKHPDPANSGIQAFLPCNNLPPLTDVDVTGSHIEHVARCIQGGAGPGGSSAVQRQEYLLRYGSHSAQLRNEVAALARHLANNIVEWPHIRALMSSRFIALDKCPGVRPIAIGEELRRIVCKALAFATGSDVAELCGVSQLCSGLEAGIEGAVHAIRDLFEDNRGNGWGLLLVDVKNAFNSMI